MQTKDISWRAVCSVNMYVLNYVDYRHFLDFITQWRI